MTCRNVTVPVVSIWATTPPIMSPPEGTARKKRSTLAAIFGPLPPLGAYETRTSPVAPAEGPPRLSYPPPPPPGPDTGVASKVEPASVPPPGPPPGTAAPPASVSPSLPLEDEPPEDPPPPHTAAAGGEPPRSSPP